jgi:16S rRNA (guanine(1405)-N(7))-methyltransferase
MQSKLKDKIIEKIKEKKELNNLDENIIKKELALHILEDKKNFTVLQEKYDKHPDKLNKYKEFKSIVKALRARLRNIFGVFYLQGYDKTGSLIKNMNKTNYDELSFQILKMHRSSKERLRYYEEIYDKIFQIIKLKPNTILDLACGVNPFSYFFIEDSFDTRPEYYCCDIGKSDIYFINEFFKKVNIKGKAFFCDLTANRNKLSQYSVDVCFLFKALDSLESTTKNITEEILQEVKTKYFVVSFPTKSIGGKEKINPSKRAWFYKLLKNLCWEYEEFDIHNELFIVIRKNSSV